jgi:hypothetical protein
VFETIIDCLATVRLARLITVDEGTPVVAARKIVTQDWATADWQTELAECPWCVSFWLGLAVVALRRLAPRWWRPVAFALASSQIAGMVIDD